MLDIILRGPVVRRVAGTHPAPYPPRKGTAEMEKGFAPTIGTTNVTRTGLAQRSRLAVGLAAAIRGLALVTATLLSASLADAATPAATVDVVATLDSRLCATVDVTVNLSSMPPRTVLSLR